MRKLLLGVAVLGIVAAACSGVGSDETTRVVEQAVDPPQTRLEAAFDGTTGKAITLADGGASIVIDGKSDDYYAFRGAMQDQFYGQVAAILDALDTPTYVIDQMDSTTSLQGVVTASWDGIEASWTYHPDNGFDLQLVDTEV